MEGIELNEVTSDPLQHHSRSSSCPTPRTPESTENQAVIEQEDRVETGAEAISSRLLFIVIGSLYLGTFLVALDTTIIGTAVPAITTEFHALDEIAWYGSSYLLALTALQPTLGKLYKVVNTKLLYLASIAMFEGTTPIYYYLSLAEII